MEKNNFKNLLLLAAIIVIGVLIIFAIFRPDLFTFKKYFTYTHPTIGYSLKLPEGWGVIDKDGTGGVSLPIRAYPYPKKTIDGSTTTRQELWNNSIVVIDIKPFASISTSTPLKVYFDKATEGLEKYEFTKKASGIHEIRVIKANENGYIIESYWLYTNKSIYQVSIGYKNASDLPRLKEYLNTILESFKD
jgi:hypothetical protein